MSVRAASFTERKRHLIVRADLERLQIRLAGREARALFAPPASGRQIALARSKASTLVAVAVPLLGAGRLRRVLRFAGIAIGVLRVARSLRR